MWTTFGAHLLIGKDLSIDMEKSIITVLEEEMRLRNYSKKTIKAYRQVIIDLFRKTGKAPRDLSRDEIKFYLLKKEENGLSSQTISLSMNAINFVYTQLYGHVDFQKFHHPKRTKKLPVVYWSGKSRQPIKI